MSGTDKSGGQQGTKESNFVEILSTKLNLRSWITSTSPSLVKKVYLVAFWKDLQLKQKYLLLPSKMKDCKNIFRLSFVECITDTWVNGVSSLEEKVWSQERQCVLYIIMLLNNAFTLGDVAVVHSRR